MASYTNTFPSVLRNGDVLFFSGSTKFAEANFQGTLPKGTYSITCVGGAGGTGTQHGNPNEPNLPRAGLGANGSEVRISNFINDTSSQVDIQIGRSYEQNPLLIPINTHSGYGGFASFVRINKKVLCAGGGGGGGGESIVGFYYTSNSMLGYVFEGVNAKIANKYSTSSANYTIGASGPRYERVYGMLLLSNGNSVREEVAPAKLVGNAGENGYSYSSQTATYTAASSSSYGYVVIHVVNVNKPPTAPIPISTTDTILANKAITLNCGLSTDPENHGITYVWEGKTDNNPFLTIGTSTVNKIETKVPTSGVSWTFRVKAVDSLGAESAWVTSVAQPINYNNAPIVTTPDIDLGEQNMPFSHTFQVDDIDIEDTLTISVLFDGKEVKRWENAQRLTDYSFNLAMMWQYVPNGNHAFKIMVEDNKGGKGYQEVKFKRNTTRLHLRLKNPIPTELLCMTIATFSHYKAPENANIQILVTNGGSAPEEEIIWEDITKFDSNASVYVFDNIPEEEHQAISYQIIIDKPTNYNGIIEFSGCKFLLYANDAALDRSASAINVDTSMFNGILSSKDYNVQKCFETIDEMKISQSGFAIISSLSDESALPTEGSIGDAYAIGTTDNYQVYIWDNNRKVFFSAFKLVGLKGDKGNVGATGIGEQGIEGKEGKEGKQGIQGIEGKEGIQGIEGKQGIQGIQGEKGAGLKIKGTKASLQDLRLELPTGGVEGDTYYLEATGECATWDAEKKDWLSIGKITGESTIDWLKVINKPLEFKPEAHENTIAQVIGLSDALDSKGRVETINNITANSNRSVTLEAKDIPLQKIEGLNSQNLQEVVSELLAQIKKGSGAMMKYFNATIKTDEWIDDVAETGRFYVDVLNAHINENTLIEPYFSAFDYANSLLHLFGIGETSQGKLRLYSYSKVTQDITGKFIIRDLIDVQQTKVIARTPLEQAVLASSLNRFQVGIDCNGTLTTTSTNSDPTGDYYVNGYRITVTDDGTLETKKVGE